MIYLLILILLLFFAFIYDFGKTFTGRKTTYYFVLILLICLSGLRYRVGGDTLMYMWTYPNIPALNELGDYDFTLYIKLQPLWVLLCSIAKSVTEEFYMLQILHAIIINTLIFSFIKANTKYIFTGILFYYIGYYGYFNFEVLRESIAIAIFLYSIKFLLNKKWFIYFPLCLIAFGFHFSAIILFIFPFIMNLKFSLLRAFFIFFIGVLLSSLFAGFVNSINLVGGVITSMKEYIEYTPTFFGLASIFIFYILYPSIIYKVSYSFLKINTKFYSFLNIYIIIGATTSLFYIFFRFLNYLTPILFIFLTEIIHGFFRYKSFRSVRGPLIIVIFFIFSFIHMNGYFSDDSKYVDGAKWYSHWYPYYSVFDKQVDKTREKLIIKKNNLYQ